MFVSELVKLCLDAMKRMVRAGEPPDGLLVAQHPVECAVSLLHKKAKDNGKVLPRGTGFVLLPASLQSKALQVHLLKQKETGVIVSMQTRTIDVLGTADLLLYCHRWEIVFPR